MIDADFGARQVYTRGRRGARRRGARVEHGQGPVVESGLRFGDCGPLELDGENL
jgi:hypothetical protein